ncbi:MAG: hypothetical protein M1832_001553 [Thelocarpon impressellum]|nr:MAG: hypothetical protein M1832_001553 [Thelocarpon impressellum]
MGGLAPGDLAFAFHRDMWSLGLAVDQRDRRPYEKAAKMYGCAGAAVDGGLGDFEGRWHYEGRGVGSASGAMWLNCAGDPEGAIRTAFRPRVPDAARGSLGRVAKVFVDECRYYLPFHNKRASPGKASASGIVPEASPQDMLNDSENVAGAPDARPVNTRDSSPEATNASPPSAEVWVLPDLVTYNGTRYVARKRGELKYYDDKGMLLNLTLVHADVAAAEAAASAQVPTPRLHSRRG